ncbi:anaerobic sulfatase maturase [candidate division KSB1 bacterium]|nr:anaerobic sulfatase maturase [candidate division KSB1 bacterium]
MRKVINSVLVKPAGPDCNLACDYCFYLKKSRVFPDQKKHRMNDQVLQALVKQVMETGGRQLSFGWQGGEPTLMGLTFFQKVVEYQKKYGSPGQIVGNGLQTNGILIDEKWAGFLHQAKFLVGLSLDGPKHVHDRYRKYLSGKSSWEKVVRARDILLAADVEVNALVVVNDYSVHYVEEIYEYHKTNGLSYMQFIPCVEPDPQDTSRTAPYSVSGEDYGRFLIKLFDLWSADFRQGQPTTFIRWFDSLFFTYVDREAPECTLLPECGVYVVVEHNGGVYSCDFFVEPGWYLGNVLENNLENMLNSNTQKRFGEVKKVLPTECPDCQWLDHCRGGCPKDRQGDPADRGSNHFCQSFKMFFQHADGTFRKLADNWKSQGPPR